MIILTVITVALPPVIAVVVPPVISKGDYCELDKNECLPDKFHELLEFSYRQEKDPFDPLEKEIKKALKIPFGY